MNDQEINLRAGLAAFSDADRVVPMNLERFDPLNSLDDLIKMLVETGISFSRPNNMEVAAEDGHKSTKKTIEDDNVVGAAVRAACELAASWIDDDDVEAWRIATGQFHANPSRQPLPTLEKARHDGQTIRAKLEGI